MRANQAAINVLQAHNADLLAEMDATKAHEAEGAASIATWAVRELHQDPRVTRQMVRASSTMRDLPRVGESARAGTLPLEQVHAFTFALKHIDREATIAVEEPLMTLAHAMTPRELFAKMREFEATARADELDEAYLRGMEKQDIACVPVGEGFHVTGFLPIDVGAKFKIFLDSISVPRAAADTRTNAERRVDGFDELMTRTLESGLPADGGVRPHLSVIVDDEKLKDAFNGPQPQAELDLDATPAILEGFGPIGPALLAYIAFGGNLTPILVAGFKANRKVLDVGRRKRVATKKQKAIVRWRQKGRCANRGCHHPIGEVHHIVAWADGGTTTIENLAGLCRKCHTLVTMGVLMMTGTHESGYRFATRDRPLARTG